MRPAYLVLGAVMLAGCGQSDEERVQEVVRDYARASANGDADTACALTAEEMFAGAGGTCEDFVALNSRPPRREAGLRQARGSYRVTIDGDRARAHGHNLGIFDLRRVDGEWKLTAVR